MILAPYRCITTCLKHSKLIHSATSDAAAAAAVLTPAAEMTIWFEKEIH